MEESMSESDGLSDGPGYGPDWDFDDDDDLIIDCPTCGACLDDDEICYNEDCPACGPSLGLSDSQLRQHERKQMGIGG